MGVKRCRIPFSVTAFGRIPPVVAPLYTYDANKNVTGETTGGVMASYTWSAGQNAEDRLIDWDSDPSGGGEERDWDLSLVGDWDEFTRDEDGQQGPLLPVVQPRNHTDAHEVDDIDGTPATHDPKGNMADDGAVSGGGIGGSRTFTWDFDNRLTSVTMPDGKVHSFTYDALGRRVSKKVDTGVMGDGPYVETVYICATHESGLGQVVAEYIKGDAASAPQKHFVYGRYVDEPLILARQAARTLSEGLTERRPRRGGYLTDLLYYHRNRKYDVVGLTNSLGVVLERYTYTPYGEVTVLGPTALIVRTASAVGNPYTYTGQRWEPESALHYFKGRYYDGLLGRFLNRDPLGYVDGYSLYAGYFAWGFGVDPSGMEPPRGLVPNRDGATTLAPSGEGAGEDGHHFSEGFAEEGERSCFDWQFASMGVGKQKPNGDFRIDAMWEIYLMNIDYGDKDCFCCPDGSEGRIEMKQWVRRRQYNPGRDWGPWQPWRPDMDGNLTPQQIKDRESRGGLFRFEYSSLHAHPNPAALNNQYQPNKVKQYSTSIYHGNGHNRGVVQSAIDGVPVEGYSWWDMPGGTVPIRAIGPNWRRNPAIEWHFYIEFVRICGNNEVVIDWAHFRIGQRYKRTEEHGFQVGLTVQPPQWRP